VLRGDIRREMQGKDDDALKLTYYVCRQRGTLGLDRYDKIWWEECRKEMERRKLPPFNR
jgi:hypothetical protein